MTLQYSKNPHLVVARPRVARQALVAGEGGRRAVGAAVEGSFDAAPLVAEEEVAGGECLSAEVALEGFGDAAVAGHLVLLLLRQAGEGKPTGGDAAEEPRVWDKTDIINYRAWLCCTYYLFLLFLSCSTRTWDQYRLLLNVTKLHR